MDLFFWRGLKELDALAFALADELFSRMPPARVEEALSGKSKQLKRRFEQTADDIVSRLDAYKAGHRLGLYKKARFQQRFLGRLQELGYSETVTRAIHERLIVYTSL